MSRIHVNPLLNILDVFGQPQTFLHAKKSLAERSSETCIHILKPVMFGPDQSWSKLVCLWKALGVAKLPFPQRGNGQGKCVWPLGYFWSIRTSHFWKVWELQPAPASCRTFQVNVEQLPASLWGAGGLVNEAGLYSSSVGCVVMTDLVNYLVLCFIFGHWCRIYLHSSLALIHWC